MPNSVAERVARPDVEVKRVADAGLKGRPGSPSGALAANEDERREARAYGAALVPAFSARPWEDIDALVRNGWAGRQTQIGDGRYDWRLSWPAVREGWETAGGRFAPPARDRAAQPTAGAQQPGPPAIGTHVFDAFGEPAGRVKPTRDRDFLLDRPLARDVYVPISAIRWTSPGSVRIAVSNAQLGVMGWERSKLLGLFDR